MSARPIRRSRTARGPDATSIYNSAASTAAAPEIDMFRMPLLSYKRSSKRLSSRAGDSTRRPQPVRAVRNRVFDAIVKARRIGAAPLTRSRLPSAT